MVMIKLRADTILIRADAGGELPLDLEQLRDELWQTCVQTGVDDSELADDIVAVIRNFVNEGPQANQSYSRCEIDELIVQILVDSGFPNVAAEYRRRRQMDDFVVVPDHVRPEPASIRLVLQRDPFFVSKPVDRIIDALIMRIASLRLADISPRLVAELGKAIWHEQEAARIPSSQAAGYWLIHRDEIPALLSGADAQLLATGAIHIRSVSSLLPRLQLQTNLGYIITDTDGSLIPELALFPAFDTLCSRLNGIVRRLISEVQVRADRRSVIDIVRARLIFSQIYESACNQPHGSGTAAARLRQDLDSIAAHHFAAFDNIEFEFE
jgi:hypothetical protein